VHRHEQSTTTGSTVMHNADRDQAVMSQPAAHDELPPLNLLAPGENAACSPAHRSIEDRNEGASTAAADGSSMAPAFLQLTAVNISLVQSQARQSVSSTAYWCRMCTRPSETRDNCHGYLMACICDDETYCQQMRVPYPGEAVKAASVCADVSGMSARSLSGLTVSSQAVLSTDHTTFTHIMTSMMST
jgi:hypothetical protein